MDDRNDKEAFYAALQAFLKQNSHRRAFIVLILRKEAQNPIAHKTLNIEPLALAAIYKQFPKLSREDALRLYAVTGGIPAVLSRFDSDSSYAENLHRFIQFDSPFCKYAEHVLSDCFRSPESYNTLLYAMARGHNRITELAEYSGFPNNKCDKYLKALAGANLIDTTQKPDNAGRLRTNYDIKNSYLKLWFRYIYAFRSGVCSPGYEDPIALRCELDRTLVREAYRSACFRRLKRNAYYDTSYPIHFDKLSQYNVVVDGYALDFVQRDNDRALIVKIWDDIDSRVDKAALDLFEAAAQKIRPLYDCTIILFAIHRFSDYCWECSGKYDNVKLVQIEGLLE